MLFLRALLKSVKFICLKNSFKDTSDTVKFESQGESEGVVHAGRGGDSAGERGGQIKLQTWEWA